MKTTGKGRTDVTFAEIDVAFSKLAGAIGRGAIIPKHNAAVDALVDYLDVCRPDETHGFAPGNGDRSMTYQRVDAAFDALDAVIETSDERLAFDAAHDLLVDFLRVHLPGAFLPPVHGHLIINLPAAGAARAVDEGSKP